MQLGQFDRQSMIRDLLNAPQTPENEMVLRSLLSEANPANFANETARLGNYLPPTTGFQQSPTQRNIEQFAREDMRAAEQAMMPRQPEPAPAPVAPEPQNWIQRTGGPKISLDQYAQPSQVKTFATDALDYSRPVDFGGTKGYWIKGDPSKIALADGRIVDTNPPVRKTLAEQRAELSMEKDRLEIEKLRKGGDTKQSWKTVESGGKLYQINESTGDMRPAIVGGEQLVGKKSDTEQAKTDAANDVGVAITSLRNAYDRLEKGGGITSTGKSSIDNLSAGISSSDVGQSVGKLFGTSNQSARNEIAMTRPALLASLMKATGMSAKQMDSNAELKLWLSTATDPTLDVESNRKALDMIEAKYLGGKSVTDSTGGDVKPPAKTPPAVGTVKSGHVYVGGDPASPSSWKKV